VKEFKLVTTTISSNHSSKLAAISGLGIAYLPLHSLRLELSARELVILQVDGFPLKRRWYAMHHKAKHLSLVASRFLEFLHETSDETISLPVEHR
jgi:DNA-binding transcriptional LysR family regulator